MVVRLKVKKCPIGLKFRVPIICYLIIKTKFLSKKGNSSQFDNGDNGISSSLVSFTNVDVLRRPHPCSNAAVHIIIIKINKKGNNSMIFFHHQFLELSDLRKPK